MTNKNAPGSLAGNGSRNRSGGGVQVQDLSQVVAEQEAAAAAVLNGDGSLEITEEQLREQAKALGLSVQRPGRRGGFRPRVDGNGYVRHTIMLSLPVRKGLEQACLQLDCSYSNMVEQALAHYFQALGLHYEGVPVVGVESAEE